MSKELNLHWPQRSRTYQHHHFDSPVWDEFVPRDGDVVVASPVKSGSTWMQQILATLMFGEAPPPEPLNRFSLFMDLRVPPRSDRLAILENQAHRRLYKTHLPLDGLVYHPDCRYVYVARDGRDVFMSLWHHYRSANDLWYHLMNDTPGRVGEPLPRCPDDIHEFWDGWISRGWFEWERDGYPFWSIFHHVATWWEYRHLPNLLLVHYNNLVNDLHGESQRIAEFLGLQPTEPLLELVAERSSFTYMKEHASEFAPLGGEVFTGGGRTFINKGSNGRWKDVLGEEEVARYHSVVEDRLPPECAHWLATGQVPDSN